jgi:hypothetical protein
VLLLGGLATIVLARPILDLLDISEPTARVAAGIAVLLTGLVDLVDPRRTGPALLRPGAALVLLVSAVDPGRLATTTALLVVVGLARFIATDREAVPTWVRWARFVAAGAILLGANLVVDGIYDL